MKVFLSWSGDTSEKLATALEHWLSRVFSQATFWNSKSKILAGESWREKLDEELQATNVGILCLVSSNIASPWLLFEAGALAKAVGSAVVPYCFGFEPEKVSGPLAKFQGVRADKEGTRKLVKAINKRLEKERGETVLADVFEKWWPDLEKQLKEIPPENCEVVETTRRRYSLKEEGGKAGIEEYMDRWIRKGGRVVIWTRDMSWAEKPGIKQMLLQKAQANELELCLPRRIDQIKEFEDNGAEIFVYGDGRVDPASRFTVAKFKQQNSRIAVGVVEGDNLVIDELHRDSRAYYIAQDLIDVVRTQQDGK